MRDLVHCGGKVKRRENDPGYRSCRCGRIRIMTIEQRAAEHKAANPDFGAETSPQPATTYQPRLRAVWRNDEEAHH